jgi:hypothetical protein
MFRCAYENASSLSYLFIYGFREKMISKHGLNKVPHDFKLTNAAPEMVNKASDPSSITFHELENCTAVTTRSENQA